MMQKEWIMIQEEIKEGYNILSSLLQYGDNICGINVERYRAVFKRIDEVRKNKCIIIEFDGLSEDDKRVRARKMMDVIKQMSLQKADREYDGEKCLQDMEDYADKCGSLNQEQQEWEHIYSGFLFDVAIEVAGYCDEENEHPASKPQQYTDELLVFFKGDVNLIEELKHKDRSTVAWMVKRWSEKGKCKNIVDFGKTKIAKLLIKNRVVEPKQEDIDKDADGFRKKF